MKLSLVIPIVCVTLAGCGTDTRELAKDKFKDPGGIGSSGGTAGTATAIDSECAGAGQGAVQTRVRYQTATVEHGATCKSEGQKRSCEENQWTSWSGEFKKVECSVLPPNAGCDDANEGDTRTRVRYEAASVPFGQSCEKEEQQSVCRTEGWSTYSGTYEQVACSPLPPEDCGSIEHGKTTSRVRYQTATVSFGASCVEEIQTASCDNGTLSEWSGTFDSPVCVVGEPIACEGGLHGDSRERVRYQSAVVDFLRSCVSEMQSQICSNGEWSTWSGTYSEESCEVTPPSDCGDIAHGDDETRTRYRAASVAFGESCESEEQSRQCRNGGFRPWSGTFAFAACSVGEPAECDGGVHAEVQERTRYEAEWVMFGGTCKAETQNRVCDDGSWSDWSGTFAEGSCTEGPPRDCKFEGHPNFGRHGESETRVMYDSAAVPFGTYCESQEQTRTCYNGDWSAWSGSGSFWAERCVFDGPRLHCDSGFTCTNASPPLCERTSWGGCAVTDELLGVCRVLPGTEGQYDLYYYVSPTRPDIATAEAGCGAFNDFYPYPL